MNNPLHARYYADCASQHLVTVERRKVLAQDTYLVRFACPEIAERITPGQFVMVRAPQGADPILGRAFAMYDVIADEKGQPHSVDIVFHVVGKLTQLLSEISEGAELIVWGPLGNGFAPPSDNETHLLMVAGGIGQTPFLALAKERLGVQPYGQRTTSPVSKVTLCYGARSSRYLAGIDEFGAAGVDVHVATDDGSAGHSGLVTELLADVVLKLEQSGVSQNEVQIVCCGPEPMMEAVGQYAIEQGIRCQLSLETPMACGLGICFSCVTRVKQSDGSWDFKRTCVDGPVFDADQLVWD